MAYEASFDMNTGSELNIPVKGRVISVEIEVQPGTHVVIKDPDPQQICK